MLCQPNDQHLQPEGGEKNFRRNLQGKFVSAPPAHELHPQAERESILGHFCCVWKIWSFS